MVHAGSNSFPASSRLPSPSGRRCWSSGVGTWPLDPELALWFLDVLGLHSLACEVALFGWFVSLVDFVYLCKCLIIAFCQVLVWLGALCPIESTGHVGIIACVSPRSYVCC